MPADGRLACVAQVFIDDAVFTLFNFEFLCFFAWAGADGFTTRARSHFFILKIVIIKKGAAIYSKRVKWLERGTQFIIYVQTRIL